MAFTWRKPSARSPQPRRRGRPTRIHLEPLEDRTLLSANPFTQVAADLSAELSALQSQVDGTLDTLRQIPILGAQVKKLDGIVNFVDKFNAQLRDGLRA